MAQLAAVFDTHPAVIAAHKLARDRFESWAANDVTDEQPDDPTDAMQLALMRWQRRMFGDQSDERMTLGIIEEMTETFLADIAATTEGALDGLGDTCVYAAQLCTSNRIALGPVLDLARLFTKQSGIKLLAAPGVLAQVVLKGKQKIRGLEDEQRFRLRLVGSIAMCIAKAIDDVEIMHDIVVRPAQVLHVVGSEVLKRGEGHDAIPKSVQPEVSRKMSAEEIEQAKHERRAKATSSMQAVLDGYDPANDAPACMECGKPLSAVGDLFHCADNTGHVFTRMQVVAGKVTTLDEAFDASDKPA